MNKGDNTVYEMYILYNLINDALVSQKILYSVEYWMIMNNNFEKCGRIRTWPY
jgi:hypothetical protein